MKRLFLLLTLIATLIIPACSSGKSNPVSPDSSFENETTGTIDEREPVEASDVLYSSASRDTLAYKAFGIYFVRIDPDTLTGEIVPSRKASAIGDTFDADLTQFLTLSPCYNCLQIDGIAFIGDSQVRVGFAIKHPFDDILARPDLHGFDIRGIVIADGDFTFPNTTVNLSSGGTADASANVNLVANPDGYTHHFDKLVEDTNYFDPPRTGYNANINPFRRFFNDTTPGPFDPHNPAGHNVMPTGSDWDTQNYTFNLDPGGGVLEFAFIADCAYGHSATYQNRSTPYYFMPEFNRKEAWLIEVYEIDDPLTYDDNLRAGEVSSEAVLRIHVSDWQAELDANPGYPDTDHLYWISAKSDVKSVSVEIPNVCGLIESDTPDSGDGGVYYPYEYLITVTNAQSAPGGIYCGIAAVRDDLDGEQGPMGIPENPNGFPFEGPEITDYSVYQVFNIRVTGSVPVIDSYNTPSGVTEGDIVEFEIGITETDGDELTYLWEQVSPANPSGLFIDATVKNAIWQAPQRADLPPAGVEITLKLTVTDIDGEDSQEIPFFVNIHNRPPVCVWIETDPFHGIIGEYSNMDIWINAVDPDGNDLDYEWDMDWDFDPGNFQVDRTGELISNFTFADQGFYNVACKMTEDRTIDPLSATCSRILIQEGISADFKIDDSDEDYPNYQLHDAMALIEDGNPVYHVVWLDEDDNKIHYANNRGAPNDFSNHQVISPGFADGWSNHARIAGNEQTINVTWNETDTSGPSYIYTLKTINSFDSGRSWTGETDVFTQIAPNTINYVDICEGVSSDEFYILYLHLQSGNYYCTVKRSTDGGESWSGGGQCRSNVCSELVSDPTIAVSATAGVVHTFWKDFYDTAPHYYYDWSDDNGVTWHDDIKISYGSYVHKGAMCATDDGSAFFVYADEFGGTDFRRTTFSTSPSLEVAIQITHIGSDMNEVDIFASPTGMNGGKTVIVPVTYDLVGSNYQNRYYYSHDYGVTFHDDIAHIFGATEVGALIGTGVFMPDPDRIEMLMSWIDYRIASYPTAHIYGEYLYLAERF